MSLGLSRATQYAIRVLVHLATRPRGATVESIAAAEEIPRAFLAKVVRRLSRAELVEAHRGRRGGVRLARPAAEVTVLEVMIAVEENDPTAGCLLGLPTCSDEAPCALHEFWGRTRAPLRDELAATSLADLVREGEGG